MNIEKPRLTLAARRQALIAQCATQRSDIARDISALRPPGVPTGGAIGRYLSAGRLKLPLTVAGVVLGIVAAKPSRVVPLIATGLSVYRLMQTALSALRKRAV